MARFAESGLLVLAYDGPTCAVESDPASVGDDPLRSGVPEGQADAHDRAGIVARDLLDDGVPLVSTEAGTLRCARHG